jgi:hypothetical protein
VLQAAARPAQPRAWLALALAPLLLELAWLLPQALELA